MSDDPKRELTNESMTGMANERHVDAYGPVPLSVTPGMRVANKSDPERFQSRADIVKPPPRPGGTSQK